MIGNKLEYPSGITDRSYRHQSDYLRFALGMRRRIAVVSPSFRRRVVLEFEKSNFIFHEQFAKMFVKVINKKGIINIGGNSQTIYQFAKKNNKKVKKIKSKGELPFKMDMSLKKYKKLIKQ